MNVHNKIIQMETPKHYKTSPDAVTPWVLQKSMQSSGSAFVDARRADAIEYAFRLKGDLLGDLKKAMHCLQEAIGELEEPNPKQKAILEAIDASFKQFEQTNN